MEAYLDMERPLKNQNIPEVSGAQQDHEKYG